MSKRILKLLVLIACLGALSFLGVKYFLPKVGIFRKLKSEEKKIEKKIKAEEEKQKTLIDKEKNLEEDPFFVEKMARDKMGLAKKNEVIYKFKEKDDNNQ
jgi:cell division protein FtsB